MKPRKLLVAPQAARDFNSILAWYKAEFGAATAAKAGRTLQAGLQACRRINARQATRPDLPDGFFRVVAKSHVIIFQIMATPPASCAFFMALATSPH